MNSVTIDKRKRTIRSWISLIYIFGIIIGIVSQHLIDDNDTIICIILASFVLMISKNVIGHGILTPLIFDLVRIIIINIISGLFAKYLIICMVLLCLLLSVMMIGFNDIMVIYDTKCNQLNKNNKDENNKIMNIV